MQDSRAEAALAELHPPNAASADLLWPEPDRNDRGNEMARHEESAERLKLTIYFADPYAPWQRDSNENTHDLLSQFMPKGTALSVLSQTQLHDIARLLNGLPRETLA